MPKEQINTPARRTIIPMRDDEGNPAGWAQGWDDPMVANPEGTIVEPTAVLSVTWTRGHIDEETPDGAWMQFAFQISADEVLRKADQIRHNRELTRLQPLDPAELPEGMLAAIVEYPAEVVTFETIAITRHEAQKLIRFTRKARDVVHGVDE